LRILPHVIKASDFLRLPASLNCKRRRQFEENIMTIKSTLIGATAAAIALTSFDLRPVAAAPEGGPAIVKQNAGADEMSAARKRRRGVHPGVPLAAFGAIVGTVGAVAAANSRRDYYERRYYAPGYYEEPAYGYYGGGPAYVAPRAYHYQHAPVYQRGDYYSRWGGSGGQPGYRGPNVNVPGPTNYGNAAGQNGQAPPAVVSPSLGGSN
jgi:hypothetical protein